jgi:hypothetical protein
MMGAAWVTEMSSPFLHLREILKELGYRDTPLNLAADVSIDTIGHGTKYFLSALNIACAVYG